MKEVGYMLVTQQHHLQTSLFRLKRMIFPETLSSTFQHRVTISDLEKVFGFEVLEDDDDENDSVLLDCKPCLMIIEILFRRHKTRQFLLNCQLNKTAINVFILTCAIRKIMRTRESAQFNACSMLADTHAGKNKSKELVENSFNQLSSRN